MKQEYQDFMSWLGSLSTGFPKVVDEMLTSYSGMYFLDEFDKLTPEELEEVLEYGDKYNLALESNDWILLTCYEFLPAQLATIYLKEEKGFNLEAPEDNIDELEFYKWLDSHNEELRTFHGVEEDSEYHNGAVNIFEIILFNYELAQKFMEEKGK